MYGHHMKSLMHHFQTDQSHEVINIKQDLIWLLNIILDVIGVLYLSEVTQVIGFLDPFRVPYCWPGC